MEFSRKQHGKKDSKTFCVRGLNHTVQHPSKFSWCDMSLQTHCTQTDWRGANQCMFFPVLLVSLWEPWTNLSMRPVCVIIQTQLALYFFREDASKSKYLGLGSSIDQRNSGVRCTGNISENWYDIYIICHDPPAQLKASLHSEAKSIKNRKNVLFESYLLPPNTADMRFCLWWCGKNVVWTLTEERKRERNWRAENI